MKWVLSDISSIKLFLTSNSILLVNVWLIYHHSHQELLFSCNFLIVDTNILKNFPNFFQIFFVNSLQSYEEYKNTSFECIEYNSLGVKCLKMCDRFTWKHMLLKIDYGILFGTSISHSILYQVQVDVTHERHTIADQRVNAQATRPSIPGLLFSDYLTLILDQICCVSSQCPHTHGTFSLIFSYIISSSSLSIYKYEL